MVNSGGALFPLGTKQLRTQSGKDGDSDVLETFSKLEIKNRSAL